MPAWVISGAVNIGVVALAMLLMPRDASSKPTDKVVAKAGSDVVLAGKGRDTVFGGPGGDVLARTWTTKSSRPGTV